MDKSQSALDLEVCGNCTARLDRRSSRDLGWKEKQEAGEANRKQSSVGSERTVLVKTLTSTF